MEDGKKDMDSKTLRLTQKNNKDTDADSNDETEAPTVKISGRAMHHWTRVCLPIATQGQQPGGTKKNANAVELLQEML